MKISKVIERLTELQKEYGDIEVCTQGWLSAFQESVNEITVIDKDNKDVVAIWTRGREYDENDTVIYIGP